MALKAVHVTDVPNLDQVTETNVSRSFYSSCSLSDGVEFGKVEGCKASKFMVIGHRGNGMNVLQSSDSRMKAIKENTILSFNNAGNYPVDFIEFDVQVTEDGYPVIFHDDLVFSAGDDGKVYEKRVTELSLAEFLQYGPQKEPGVVGRTLLRKAKNGKIMNWGVESDDSLCTLQEAFQKVKPSLGFNIELKFDDYVVYQQEYLTNVVEAVLGVVSHHANERPIIFSTFQPDAALLLKKFQSKYPVFFLTNGGNEIYNDVRRNSLEEAVKLCLEGGLQGIVSEVRGVFRNPGAVNKIKESKLSLLTYGKLNNVLESVYLQHLMGIEGVIVDFVQEITQGVEEMLNQSGEEEILSLEGEEQIRAQENRPQFSQKELAFLLKLIPELIEQ